MIRVVQLSGEEVATMLLEALPCETVRSLKRHLNHSLGLPNIKYSHYVAIWENLILGGQSACNDWYTVAVTCRILGR